MKKEEFRFIVNKDAEAGKLEPYAEIYVDTKEELEHIKHLVRLGVAAERVKARLRVFRKSDCKHKVMDLLYIIRVIEKDLDWR